MSGFPRGLAKWALGGGANNNNNNNNDEDGSNEGGTTMDEGNTTGGTAGNNAGNALPPPPRTVAEIRAQRLERLDAMANEQQAAAAAAATSDPMEVDSVPSKPVAAAVQLVAKAPPLQKSVAETPHPPPPTKSPSTKRKAKDEALTPEEQARKWQRKKEVLLKKTMLIVLKDGHTSHTNSFTSRSLTPSTSPDDTVVPIDTGSNEISPDTVAECLALRLSADGTRAGQSPRVLPYLSGCHTRIRDELKAMHSSSSSSKTTAAAHHDSVKDTTALLQELQAQTVSYAVTCLTEPDLFPNVTKDIHHQLAHCLLMDPQFAAGTQSFYNSVMQELQQQSSSAMTDQDDSPLQQAVTAVVDYYGKLLSQCDSVQANTTDVVQGTTVLPVTIVSALTRLCQSKPAAKALTQHPHFFLPKPGTPEAIALTRPNLPTTGANPLEQFLAGGNGDRYRPYRGRSGRALEQHTILGRAFCVGAPVRNPAFRDALRQRTETIHNATTQQRTPLQAYQQQCHEWIRALLAASEKDKVTDWFQDALLVNTGASALRPDAAKVSVAALRYNVQTELLRLCEPIVTNLAAKQSLIQAGFLSSVEHHGGVFGNARNDGDDAVPRLGGGRDGDDGDNDNSNRNSTPSTLFAPKNTFIPTIFFLCARSIHFGLVPGLSAHENLLRSISHYHYTLLRTNSNRDVANDPRLLSLSARQHSDEVALFHEDLTERSLRYGNALAKVVLDYDDATLRTIPEEFVTDLCDMLLHMATLMPKQLAGLEFRHVFELVVKLLSPKYASMVRNYNLRAQLGDVLHEIFLPPDPSRRREQVPESVSRDPLAGGQTYLLANAAAQETLAPSLLLLYGEVEHTGYYDKMSHRAKIASLIKYLWDSKEHRPAFQRITENKESFIKFANGIMNETNTLIATVMQKLPEIREAQEKIKNVVEWARLSEDEQTQITSRLEDSERDVKSSLPLCNKTLQMFGYLNTDKDIRGLFLLDELCSRLVTMLLHVLTKLVGSKGLDLKVDNPEQYDFRPKEMLRDLCAIFGLFADQQNFQEECAKSGCDPTLLQSAVKTCQRLTLLTDESMSAFAMLPGKVTAATQRVAAEEALLADAPDEFLDELLTTVMNDPVMLPSGHFVNRSTITTHLLNDPMDPFSREPLTIDQVKPAPELKEKIDEWIQAKRDAAGSK